MKKSLIIFVIIGLAFMLIEAPVVHAQAYSATTLKAGYFNPKGAKAGFIFGGNYSWIVDESVDIGIGVDFFRKGYTDETELYTGTYANGVAETKLETNADFTTTILPVYGVINVKFPAGTYLDYIVGATLGYEWLWSNVKTYGENETDDSKSYNGFKWLLSGGIAYRVGSRSTFIAEVYYDGTKVSRDRTVEQGAPVRYEVDLAGLGFRVGVRMGFH
ncbi:outer membrane beta-barrel protein [candidate division KSB1 bacterium]|nr:outer membrane beta-barrel protein [candidate division KSB1 bacterium]